MKRIDVHYGGENYSVGSRDIAELRAEIADAVMSGDPFWLEVNSGDGVPRPAHLLLTAGTPIALVEAPEPEDAGD